MSGRVVYLTDEQPRKIEPLIPKKPVGPKGGRHAAWVLTDLSRLILDVSYGSTAKTLPVSTEVP